MSFHNPSPSKGRTSFDLFHIYNFCTYRYKEDFAKYKARSYTGWGGYATIATPVPVSDPYILFKEYRQYMSNLEKVSGISSFHILGLLLRKIYDILRKFASKSGS